MSNGKKHFRCLARKSRKSIASFNAQAVAGLPLVAFSGGGAALKIFQTWKSAFLEIDAVFDTIAQACPSR